MSRPPLGLGLNVRGSARTSMSMEMNVSAPREAVTPPHLTLFAAQGAYISGPPVFHRQLPDANRASCSLNHPSKCDKYARHSTLSPLPLYVPYPLSRRRYIMRAFECTRRGGATPRRQSSYNITDDGIKLLSASAREFQVTNEGLQTTTSRTGQTPPSDLCYRCSARDVHVFHNIGAGASGVVKKAVHVPSHRFIALKIMTVFEKEKRRQLINEMRTLCDSPRQPGLVSFFGAFYSPETNQINIALEYIEGGSLESIVKKAGAIPIPELGKILGGVLQGLEYLHCQRKVVHRDIKPGNILMKLNGEPKITDFGISAELGQTQGLLDSFKGTMCYMSPERIQNQDYNFAADIWSLGLTFLECAVGKYPYDHLDGGPLGLMMQITQDDPPIPQSADFPSSFTDFVGLCMRKDAADRPTTSALRGHELVRDNAGVKAGVFMKRVVDPMKVLNANAESFIAHYYRLVDHPAPCPETLGRLYRDNSCFTTAQGDQVRGGEHIGDYLAHRASIGAGSLVRQRLSFDVLPGGVEGGVLILATGRFIGSAEGERDNGGGKGSSGVGSGNRSQSEGEGRGPLSFEFIETFLVLQVHEEYVGPSGGQETGTGMFYVRNHIERWRKL